MIYVALYVVFLLAFGIIVGQCIRVGMGADSRATGADRRAKKGELNAGF